MTNKGATDNIQNAIPRHKQKHGNQHQNSCLGWFARGGRREGFACGGEQIAPTAAQNEQPKGEREGGVGRALAALQNTISSTADEK